jgi:hypothetical protein
MKLKTIEHIIDKDSFRSRPTGITGQWYVYFSVRGLPFRGYADCDSNGIYSVEIDCESMDDTEWMLRLHEMLGHVEQLRSQP